MADAVVALTPHARVSRHTIGRRLAENDLKPWQQRMWCVPKIDAEYVARMEDVLDLYRHPPAAGTAVVGVDESPRQLIGEVRLSTPGGAGPSGAAGLRVPPQRLLVGRAAFHHERSQRMRDGTLETASAYSTVQSVSDFTSLMKMRRPDTAGCAQVELAATVYRFSTSSRSRLLRATVSVPLSSSNSSQEPALTRAVFAACRGGPSQSVAPLAASRAK